MVLQLMWLTIVVTGGFTIANFILYYILLELQAKR